MNNLEWLRTLDIETLAERMDDKCTMCAYDGINCGPFAPCKDGMTKWLEQEHEEPKKPKEPDSWEKIEADANLISDAYWNCMDCSCEECPAEIDGLTPKERYVTRDCDVAMEFDLRFRCSQLLKKKRSPRLTAIRSTR